MFLNRNGTKIRYEFIPTLYKADNIETIVLIHGAGFDLTTWDALIPLLQPRYRLLLFDLRGHGESERGEESFGPVMFEEDLLVLLDLFDINRFHMISHGAGSIISLYFARDYPDRMLTQTLISLPVFGSTETAQKFATYRQDFQVETSLLPLAEHLLSFVTLYPKTSPIWKKLRASFLRVTESVYLECLHFFLGSHDEVSALLNNCEIPTLLLAGEHDPLFPPYLSDLAASLNDRVRHRTIYEAANMVFVDRPQETLRQWQDFLEGVPYFKQVHNPFFDDFHIEIREWFQPSTKVVEKKKKDPTPFLQVKLLSHFEVYLDGVCISNGWNKRSAKELFVYLLLNPGVSRERLCEDLWPDHDLKKSKDRLRVYLSYLKSLLAINETSILQTDSGNLRLLAVIDCDLLQRLEQLDAADQAQNMESQTLLLGNLFAGLKQDPFHALSYEWSMASRTAFEVQLTRLTYKICAYLISQERRHEALAYSKILSFLYPEPLEICDGSATNLF